MLGDAALGPQPGALQGLLLVAAGVHQRGQLVEGEHDVRAELVLHLHRDLRREAVPVAVEVGLEPDAVVVDVGQPLLAGGHLVVRAVLAAAASMLMTFLNPEPRLITWKPPESVKVGPSQFMNLPSPPASSSTVCAGLQVQVVGVGQQRLRAEVLHGLGQHRLDCGLGADGDERRGLDLAVRGGDGAGASIEPTAVVLDPCGGGAGGVGQAIADAEGKVRLGHPSILPHRR